MKHIILHKETNEIQRVMALRSSRNKRFSHKEFIIEGTLNINQAIKYNWPIKSIFYNNDARLSGWAKNIVQNTHVSAIFAVSKQIMGKISERKDCPELIMIGQMQSENFFNYFPSRSDVVVVLDQPKSAGNLGMIIRSAAAFGVNAIVISGHAADEYDPQCLRSSVGNFFNMPIFIVEGIEKFCLKINKLKMNQNIEIIASGNKGSVSLNGAKFSKELLFIVFGNESQGISEGYRRIADTFIHIPLKGDLTSLNVGAAASIFLYEIMQQRNENR